jgi:hypothetical protein
MLYREETVIVSGIRAKHVNAVRTQNFLIVNNLALIVLCSVSLKGGAEWLV